MALGKFADKNPAWTAAFSGGGWEAALPVGNLAQDERFVERPARTASLDPADTQFDCVLDRPRTTTLVALLFHSMSLSGRYRLSVAGVGGDLDDPLYQTDWTDVYPRLFASESLEWEEPNWWTGQALPEDIDLYRRHCWIQLPEPLIIESLRVELDDADNEAGFIDIGGVWITAGWSPEFNFERGRELGIIARDLKEEGPSGRVFGQRREGRRYQTVSWTGLTEAEARRLFDAGARAGTTRPVLFIPDLDDVTGTYREAWPATFQRPPAPRFNYAKTNQVAATFEEIIR